MFIDHEVDEASATPASELSDVDGTDTPSWLFSFGASNVKTMNTRKGQMNFTFDADDSSLVTAFTDRPARLTDRLSMKNFAQNFNEIFGDDKPNASLTHWDLDGNFYNHVYEIKGIKKRNGKYILKSDLLESDFTEALPLSKDQGSYEPPVIEQANFFVDGAIWSFLCNFFGGTTGECASACDWGWIDGIVCGAVEPSF